VKYVKEMHLVHKPTHWNNGQSVMPNTCHQQSQSFRYSLR